MVSKAILWLSLVSFSYSHMPGPYPKIIALDLDGTLLNSSGTVTEPTLQSLCGFVEEGGHVVIATGRGSTFTKKLAGILQSSGLRLDWAVCCDGAVVLVNTNVNTLSQAGEKSVFEVAWTNIPAGSNYPTPASIYAALPGAGIGAEIDGVVVTGSDRYLDAIATGSPLFAAKYQDITAKPDFDGLLERANHVAWMRIVPPLVDPPMGAEELSRRIGEVLAATPRAVEVGLKVRPSTPPALRPVGAVTVSRTSTDKSTGLAVVAQALGLSPRDFLAFGDADNDLGMFEWAEKSCCPANANGNAKASATCCSRLSNDQDFIAEAIAELSKMK